MMDIRTIALPEVFHAGTLRPADRTSRASLEAFMLSVSLDPEDWASIARCGGETHALHREDARYVDAMAMGGADMAEVMDWAVAAGHAQPAVIWRVWSWDDEGDTWRYLEFADREAAEHEIGPDRELDEDAPTDSGARLEARRGHILTPSGMAALERWHAPTNAQDGALILWAREVAAGADDRIVGVWWNEDHDPEALSCPRGGIFPEKLAGFRIRSLAEPEWEPEP